MPLVVKDRVKETTTTTGTGTVTLAGAVSGYQSFSVIGNGNTTYYAIVGPTEWEVGLGTYTSSGTTLSRDTVLESSNSGNLVDFAAGSKDVFVTYPAERSLYVDGTSITPATSATLPITSGGTGSSTATFSGANITSLNASNISSGTLSNDRTTASSSNGASTIVSRGASGEFAAGTITATFSGDGSGVTAINANNISTGVLVVARGGTGVNTLTGLVVGNGTSAFTAVTAPSGTVVGTTDTQTLTNKTLTDPAIIGTVLEDVYPIQDGVGFAVDPGNGSIQTITLGASRTPVASNWLEGESVTLMVDDGTAYTLTWTSNTWGGSGVVWETDGGVAPTLATTGYTAIVLWKVGTQVYGARVGNT